VTQNHLSVGCRIEGLSKWSKIYGKPTLSGVGFFITRNVLEEIGNLRSLKRDGKKRVEDILLKTLKVTKELAETERGRFNDGLEK
jgi:hypothetical protein